MEFDKDEYDRVSKMVAVLNRPLTSYLLKTTDALLDKLVEDGIVKSLGSKFDSAQYKYVNKYIRTELFVA